MGPRQLLDAVLPDDPNCLVSGIHTLTYEFGHWLTGDLTAPATAHVIVS